jgi:hypothetical protein
MRIKGLNIGEGGGGGCMGCASGPLIGLIVAFLVGVIWSANQFYQQPWNHFYLPDWAKVTIGGVAVFIIFTTAIILNTASNAAAIWAAGTTAQKQRHTYSIESQDTIREVAGTTRAVSTQNAMLNRENTQLRRQLEQAERPALPAPEEMPMVRFDESILNTLDEMDVIDAE